MTTGALQPIIYSPDGPSDAGPEPAQPPRSQFAEALAQTFSGVQAKVSLAWIGVLVFCAVFAPFIATSHPWLMNEGGRVSSPVLRHLTPPDVALLLAFFTAAVLLVLRGVRHRFLIFLGVVTILTVLAWLVVKPPATIVYSRYREDTQASKIKWAIYAPIRFSPNDRQRDKGDARLQPPDREHWMGTDGNGADVLSRIVHASRIALAVGFISTGIAVVIGVVIGGVMGYFVGRVDLLGMRLIEIFEAIPTLFLLITFVAFFGRNLYLIMAIIGLTSWTGDARYLRAEFLRLRNQDFVQAAKAAGLPLRSILFRHMLPNGVTPVLIGASFGVASAILLESVLSFLGLGLVEEPSWGGMLEQARTAGRFVWWLAFYPGMAIFFTVFAYNLIGEALRDALDPKLRGT